MAGGGVSSLYDQLEDVQYFEDELHAAVMAAEDAGTYVMVHVYVPEAIRRAIRAGVKSIEHGQLIDEPTMKLIAEKGVWLSMQPFIGEGNNHYTNPVQQAKTRTGGTRHRPGLSAGEEIRGEAGMGYRLAFQSGQCTESKPEYRKDDPLVFQL